MINVETKLLEHPSESMQMRNISKHFLVQTCSYCNDKFELAEGDVIFGDKWFHGICWRSFNTTKKN